nr:hypothetical protein [Tanacetum cinerariifolium]
MDFTSFMIQGVGIIPILMMSYPQCIHLLLLSLRARKAPFQASKVAGDASTPLDVDSDLNRHGLRVADSHTGNHPEDDFMPLETIRRPYSVIRKRIIFELEWETFKPRRRFVISTQMCTLSKEQLNQLLHDYDIPQPIRVILPKNMIKLTTFVVMCKAYGGEPFVVLLRSFLNLGRPGDWLTLSSRGGADRLGRYPTSVHVFPNPILFLAGLKSLWEHDQQRLTILVGDLACRGYSGFWGSPKPELSVVYLGSVAAQIKDMKCKTREGSSRPPIKRKLAFGSSTSRATHAKTLPRRMMLPS